MLDLSMRLTRAEIDYDTTGLIASGAVEARMLLNGSMPVGSPVRRIFSRDEALAAGVTGAQAQALQDAVTALRSVWQTDLLGA